SSAAQFMFGRKLAAHCHCRRPARAEARSVAVTSKSPSLTRRGVLAATAAAGAVSLVPLHWAAAGEARLSQASKQGDPKMATEGQVRPFSFHAPEAELADLRKRVNATKWPEREQVTDDTQGVQLDTIQKLARYWATEYDWRKVEARLNALP